MSCWQRTAMTHASFYTATKAALNMLSLVARVSWSEYTPPSATAAFERALGNRKASWLGVRRR